MTGESGPVDKGTREYLRRRQIEDQEAADIADDVIARHRPHAEEEAEEIRAAEKDRKHADRRRRTIGADMVRRAITIATDTLRTLRGQDGRNT